MTELRASTPLAVTNGVKTVSFRMSSGTGKIQMRTGDDAFVDIASSSKSASADFNITVPDCDIQAVLTGDATAKVNGVS